MFRRWKDEWERYLIENPPRTGGGIASQAEKALNRHGSSFARLVVEALSQERITSLEAARYLDLKYPHIEALRRELLFAGREERATV